MFGLIFKRILPPPVLLLSSTPTQQSLIFNLFQHKLDFQRTANCQPDYITGDCWASATSMCKIEDKRSHNSYIIKFYVQCCNKTHS